MNIKDYKLFLELQNENSINEEVGLRNLKKIAKGLDTIDKALVGTKRLEENPLTSINNVELSKIVSDSRKCEIYFHKDLDGVTSALAMKQILKSQYRIDCVDCHTIQYGGLEFAVQQPKPGNLSVLVDFAHSKPMFTIATDHHQEQVGAEDTSSTYYKPSRSNVETISGEIAKQEIFPQKDIEFIQTIDSANFLKYNVTPEEVQNSIFKLDKSIPMDKLKFMMGFVTNRLLLAYKNKAITVKSKDGKRNHINKNILECLVLDSSPNLYSMYNNLIHYMNSAVTSDKLGRLATPEEITVNLGNYIQTMKSYKGKEFDEDYKILRQYGGGSMIKPGSYDRYVVFGNNPETEFFAITWPMGLIQVSCNPFKEKALKDINLGEIAKEVLAKFEPKFGKYFISLKAIKEVYETSQDWKSQQKVKGEEFSGIGFKYSDLSAFYMDCIYQKSDMKVSNILDKTLEISFRANSKLYEDIDVVIEYEGLKFQFKITESSLIIEFVEKSLNKNIQFNPLDFGQNKYKESIPFENELTKKQLQGAKNNIANLLKRLDLVVANREKISVFKPFKDSTLVDAMNSPFSELDENQLKYLNNLKIPVWELITRNSGGHPSITNISGLNFLAYNKAAMEVGYKTNKYTDIMSMIVDEFIKSLKQKVDLSRQGVAVTYDTKGVELLGQDINENFSYQLVDKFTGQPKPVTKEEFLKAGSETGMRKSKKSSIIIDNKNKKLIAKFENFNNSKL